MNITGNESKNREFKQRLIISLIAMAVILALTFFAFAKSIDIAQGHALEDIKDAAEASDQRMHAFTEETFRTLNGIAKLSAAGESSAVEENELQQSMAALSIGEIGMESRLYLPDGRLVTGEGVITLSSEQMDFEAIVYAMRSGRYISCPKADYLHADEQVIEFIVPVRRSGQVVALLSAVLNLKELPAYMAPSSFEGQADVLFMDTKEGTVFLNTRSNSGEAAEDVSTWKDTNGSSILPFLQSMQAGKTDSVTVKNESTGESLYLYTVPSEVSGWAMCICVNEKIAFSERISAGRELCIVAIAEVLICLLFIIWMFRSARRQAVSDSRELLNRMATEEGLFIIDCVNDTRKTIHNHCAGGEKYTDEGSYSESMAKYVENGVAPADREKMRTLTSLPYIRERLKKESEYTVEYRDISTNIQRFYKMRMVRYSENEVLQSFAERDREIVDRLIFSKLESEYFAISVVDLDSGLAQILKKAPWHTGSNIGTVESFPLAMKNLAKLFSGETANFFTKIADTEYLRLRFASDEKASFIYPDSMTGTQKWCSVTGLVLARHEDGAPSLLAMCFSLLDSGASEKESLQRKLESSMKVVGGLASEYAALFYVDLDAGDYIHYYYGDKASIGSPSFEKYPLYIDLLNAFIDGDLVHPDHRARLHEFYSSNKAVRKALENKKEISILFLRKYEEEYTWTQLKIVKCEAAEEEAHKIVVGFIEKDAEVRREIELEERRIETEENKKLIDGISSENNIVYVVNMADDSLGIRRMDDTMLEKKAKFSNFFEMREFLLSKVIHPRDRERIAAELEYDTIRRKLSQKSPYSATYCLIKNEATLWGEMQITAFGEDKFILAMAQRDTQIAQRVMESLREEKNFAMYYVDLDTEMIREVKNTLRTAKNPSSTKVFPYQQKLREFASLEEGDGREFFLQISDIDFIKKDLSEASKRSFAFKSTSQVGWTEVYAYVIERHPDGSPAIFALGFNQVDSLGTSIQEKHKQLGNDMEIIGCLASEFRTLYHLNLDSGIMKAYSLEGRQVPEPMRVISKGGNPYDALRRYAQTVFVHPEDRYLFENLSAELLRDKLAHSKSYRMSFRQKEGDRYNRVEMVVVKKEAVEERANSLAIGFTERESVQS